MAVGMRARADAKEDEVTDTAKLCPNCESDRHARCCSWCGKVHKPARLDYEHCSTKCSVAAVEADRLSAAMEETP